MALEFRGYGPDPGEAVRNRMSGSLDSILNAYAAMKEKAMAEKDRQATNLLQYGFDPRQVTPDVMRQAGQPGPQGQTLPATAPQAPSLITPQGPQQFMGGLQQQMPQGPMVGSQTPTYQPPTQQEPEIVGHVRSYLDKKRRAEQISQDDTEAQALQRRALATKDLADARLADRKPFEMEHGEKKAQFVAKRLTALGDALDESKGRNGALGVSKTVFDRAERLETLANAAKGNPDKRQMEEFAIGINAMLSGSNTGSQEQVKALLPSSLKGDVSKVREWLTNSPTGTDQQEFVKRMSDTIAREKATAAEQIKRTKFSRVAQFHDASNLDPDGFKSVLYSHDVDPDEYASWTKGGFKKQSAVQGAGGGNHDALLNKYGAP
jgi:hypothetical protein